MPTIVDFPTIVKDALTVFGEVFDTEAARRHFAEYLTGLIVAENKTVSGMDRKLPHDRPIVLEPLADRGAMGCQGAE